MKCLKNKCRYYIQSDNLVLCDLVIDDVIEDDVCIGYKQIQKEMDDAFLDMACAFRKYEKLQRLEARINKQ